ncbi:unnamed protein product [Schistosoma turkestanicum]|nr:unnamed protein product [Schistosoma turkestanicum]
MSHVIYLTRKICAVATMLLALTLLFQSVDIIYNYSSVVKDLLKSVDLASVSVFSERRLAQTLSKERSTISISNNTQRIFISPSFSSGSDEFEYPMMVDMPKVVREVLSNLPLTIRPINDPRFPILIGEYQKCDNILLKTGEPPELLILIKSAPSNYLRRNTIRLTWGNDLCWGGRRVVHLFLLGNVPPDNTSLKSIIKNESNVYHDIIQQDFLDTSYHNNTYKAMFGINWAVKYCSKVPIIMFVDDDYFVYPKNVIAYIEGLSTELRKLLISGYVWFDDAPYRRDNSSNYEWFIDYKEYAPFVYPPYVAAGNYFLSMDLAREMNVAMLYTKYFRIDDVYLGIILRKLLRLPIHLKQVYTNYPVNLNSSEIYEMISSLGFGESASQFFLWNRLNCSTFCVKSLV